MDSLRYFAEASDRVNAIDVFSETYSDLSGSTISLLEAIRDDYGTTVAIPLYLFDHSSTVLHPLYPMNSSGSGGIATAKLAPNKVKKLSESNLALSLVTAVEFTSNITPIYLPTPPAPAGAASTTGMDLLDHPVFQYRLAGGIALETLLSYRRLSFQSATSSDNTGRGGNAVTTKEYLFSATAGGHLPYLSFEGLLPGITHSQCSTADMLEALSPLRYGSVQTYKPKSVFLVNPFMTTLSPYERIYRRSLFNQRYVYSSKVAEEDVFDESNISDETYDIYSEGEGGIERRYLQPLTNNVFVRGFDLPSETSGKFVLTSAFSWLW